MGAGWRLSKMARLSGACPCRSPGLLSPLPVPEIAQQVDSFDAVMPELGLPPMFPITLLALALPVIPTIRLTDIGMVDIFTQQFVPMLAA